MIKLIAGIKDYIQFTKDSRYLNYISRRIYSSWIFLYIKMYTKYREVKLPPIRL